MKILLTLFTLLIAHTPAFAGEEELYAPVPPADSAFVRTISLAEGGAPDIRLDGARFPSGATGSVSDYMVVKQGGRTLSDGGKTWPLTIEAGQYYTVAVAKDGEPKLFKDALIENPAKAMLYFYNLSDAAAANLVAPSHNATIFENVAPGANDVSREINASVLDLAVKADGADVATLEKVELKRQAGVSVFLTGGNGQYKAFSVYNKVAQ